MPLDRRETRDYLRPGGPICLRPNPTPHHTALLYTTKFINSQRTFNSLKGALRSRWLFFGKYALDLLNVHLINEKDNISSIRRFPTTTLEARKRNLAMELLRECKIDKYVDDAKVVIRDTKEDVTLLSVGRKFFHLGLLLKQHFMQNLETIRQFDEEPFAFSSDLHELPVMFPPTYPFDDLTNEFSGSRCPAWCDRIFLSKSAMALLPIETSEYNSIRCEVSTGDHKPVYLRLDLNIFVSPRSEDHLPRISISINGNPVSVDDAFTMAWR
uniref:inositol-polyphosphate 5-phosphatase n=1 Tax=Mesocestoides corti TaxID=53468 RepID=A0A5K3FP88_MESCO